jgi:mycofactocin precursor
MEDVTTTADVRADVRSDISIEEDALVEDELLVEEISIDGMCGVY